MINHTQCLYSAWALNFDFITVSLADAKIGFASCLNGLMRLRTRLIPETRFWKRLRSGYNPNSGFSVWGWFNEILQRKKQIYPNFVCGQSETTVNKAASIVQLANHTQRWGGADEISCSHDFLFNSPPLFLSVVDSFSLLQTNVNTILSGI